MLSYFQHVQEYDTCRRTKVHFLLLLGHLARKLIYRTTFSHAYYTMVLALAKLHWLQQYFSGRQTDYVTIPITDKKIIDLYLNILKLNSS